MNKETNRMYFMFFPSSYLIVTRFYKLILKMVDDILIFLTIGSITFWDLDAYKLPNQSNFAPLLMRKLLSHKKLVVVNGIGQVVVSCYWYCRMSQIRLRLLLAIELYRQVSRRTKCASANACDMDVAENSDCRPGQRYVLCAVKRMKGILGRLRQSIYGMRKIG